MDKFNTFKHYNIEIGEDPEKTGLQVYIVVNKHTGVKEIHSSTLPDLLHYVQGMDDHLTEYLNDEFEAPKETSIHLN